MARYYSDETFWDCILEAESEAEFEAVAGAFYDDRDALEPFFMIMRVRDVFSLPRRQ